MKRIGVVGSMLFLVLTMATAADLQYSSNAVVGLSARLNAVVYGTNRFVAVGTNSTAITSLLGTNAWLTSRVAMASRNLSAVTYGNGLFVVGAQNSAVFSSTNGIDWTPRPNAFASSAAIKGLAFNAGRFVAVAPSALIRHSTNLQTWSTATIVNPAVLEGYRSVTRFGIGGMAVCGLGGVIRISLDAGRTWRVAGTNSHHSSKPTLLGIATDGASRLVCVGMAGRIMVSADGGTTWSIGESKTTKTLNGVAFTGSGFVAAGDGGLILSSGDGASWATNSSPVSTNLYGLTFATSGSCQGAGVMVGAIGNVVIAGEKPAKPTDPVDQTICADGPLTPLCVSVTDPNQVTVDWYDSASGGMKLATGTKCFTTNNVSGTYYAQARNLCTRFVNTDRTAVTLTVNPLPAVYDVIGGGAYCAGSSGAMVGLSGSQLNVSYQLMRDGINVGSPVTGTGDPLSFAPQLAAGTYTVMATTNTTLCTRMMSQNAVVTIAPLPTVFPITGGGSYCAGGVGVVVGLAGSQAGVSYQLLRDGSNSGGSLVGNGGAMDFGAQIVAGTYTVTASNETACTATMTGAVQVSLNPLPEAPLSLGNQTNCVGVTNPVLSVSVDNGATVDWYDASTGGTALAQGTNRFRPVEVVPGTYTFYAQARSLTGGCLSTNRTPVLLTLQECKESLAIRVDGTNIVVEWQGNLWLQGTDALLSSNNLWLNIETNAAAGKMNSLTNIIAPDLNRFFRLSGHN